MKEVTDKTNHISTTKNSIIDTQKFTIILYSVSIVHICLACFFIYLHITPLIIYNIFSVSFYIILSIFSKKGNLILCFFFTYIEIILHTLLATYYTGWEGGFTMFTIAIVPVSYFIFLTVPKLSHKILIPSLASGGCLITFFISRLYSLFYEPVYSIKESNIIIVIYLFNATVTFILLILFSILFSVEIQYAQKALKQQNNELNALANMDPLTSLLNRRSMNQYLSKALLNINETKSYSLILGDIDDFKKINDTYGHKYGDLVLIKISELIRNNIRENDYACRWGGEEFLILVKSNIQEAERIAERIRLTIAESYVEKENMKIQYTMTFGIAQIESKYKKIEETIQKADERLYYGKLNGKNQVVSSS